MLQTQLCRIVSASGTVLEPTVMKRSLLRLVSVVARPAAACCRKALYLQQQCSAVDHSLLHNASAWLCRQLPRQILIRGIIS